MNDSFYSILKNVPLVKIPYNRLVSLVSILEVKFHALMRVSFGQSYNCILSFVACHRAAVVPASRITISTTLSHRLLQDIIMKRAASSTAVQSKAKKAREDEPAYHLTPSTRGDDGEIIWPAPKMDIENARRIIKEW